MAHSGLLGGTACLCAVRRLDASFRAVQPAQPRPHHTCRSSRFRPGETSHALHEVPDVGHDHAMLWQSAVGRLALFGGLAEPDEIVYRVSRSWAEE